MIGASCRRAAWLALLTALATPVSCASRGDEGSESNFSRCDTDADCRTAGTSYECIGGICVQAPRADAASVTDGATGCRASECPIPAFGVACCAGPAGPCGVDTGFGCEPWKTLRDAAADADAQ